MPRIDQLLFLRVTASTVKPPSSLPILLYKSPYNPCFDSPPTPHHRVSHLPQSSQKDILEICHWLKSPHWLFIVFRKKILISYSVAQRPPWLGQYTSLTSSYTILVHSSLCCWSSFCPQYAKLFPTLWPQCCAPSACNVFFSSFFLGKNFQQYINPFYTIFNFLTFSMLNTPLTSLDFIEKPLRLKLVAFSMPDYIHLCLEISL